MSVHANFNKNACQVGSPTGSSLSASLAKTANPASNTPGRNGDLVVIDTIDISYTATADNDGVSIAIYNGVDNVLFYQDSTTASSVGNIHVEFNNGYPIFNGLNTAGLWRNNVTASTPQVVVTALNTGTVNSWNVGYHFESARSC